MVGAVVIFVLVLIGAAVTLCLAVVGAMAWSLTHPPRMTDGKATWRLRRLSPEDVGLVFEEMRFDLRDESGSPLSIAAWWIPNPQAQGRCAMIVHGYADAKVGAIAWAPLWHALGFNLLVPDLRAHGESGGTASTAGFFERHDLSQVIGELRARNPADARTVVLFGTSIGAAVAAATACEMPDVAAVVMDSPYADFSRAAAAHMDHLGAPGGLFQSMAIRLAQWLTRANYDAVRPVDLLRRLPCPVLVIESADDPFLATQDRQAISDAIRSRLAIAGKSEIWIAEGASHLLAVKTNSGEYARRLTFFLTQVPAIQPAVELVAPVPLLKAELSAP